MKVRLKRPVFAEVVIDEIAHAHWPGHDERLEVTTTARPKGGAVAVPFDHDELPILTAEQMLEPRELCLSGTSMVVHPPDWIVTSPEGESLPCPHDEFLRLFEMVPN